MLGPQFSYIKTSIRPFDTQDAESDPQAVQEFNAEYLNQSLGDPTHSLVHEFGTSKGRTGTAITKHHPGGVVLDSIHVDSGKRGRGEGTGMLNRLTSLYGKLVPSGHYVDQQALDWHNKHWNKFKNDPEYGGSRIVEAEEGW